MTPGSEVPPASTPLSTINMSSPLPLQDWNQAFMLSTPVRPTSRHTPSKTNWKLGTAQRTPQARTPAALRTPTLSTRRVQQGASLASTPAQCGQRVMPRSKTSDLIAPSLANLPNALDADYWLKKIQIQEQLGMYKAAVDLFELAVKRDVRPATTISRAYGEFLIRHNLPGPTGTSNATMPLNATRRTQVQRRTRFADEEQENSAGQNIISPTKFTATKPKRKCPPARRQSHVHFQTPEANVVSEAADPYQDERNNSSKAGSTPFHAKAMRRVSFAATNQAADTRSVAAEEPSDSLLSASTCDLAKRWLGHSNEELQFPVDHSASESHQVAAPTDGQVRADAAADAFGSEAQHTEEDDDDDNSSIGTVSVAAGSTPYLNRSMLSAALQAANPSDSLPDTVEGGMDRVQGTDLSSMMARLLSPEPDAQDEAARYSEDYDEVVHEHLLIDHGSAGATLPCRPGSLLSNTLSPETGAIHLTPAVLHGAPTALHGDGTDATCTPGDGTGLYAIDPTAVTPLCLDLDSLQISGTSSRPASITPSSPTHGDDAAASPEASIPFSLPSGLSAVRDTPALQGARMGWNRSVFDTTGDGMSPELLGWYEKQGFDQTPVVETTPGPTPPEAEPEQPAPSFQFLRTPASLVQSKHAAEPFALGKAVRVKTPANRPRVGKSELKGLIGNSPPRKAQDMGSIALLSPVRADGRLTNQLGAAKVVTPVRRSARKSLATPLIASMLRETEFAYAPNEALPRRRPSMFESPTPYTEDAAASVQDDDDNASTRTSITGVSLAGDLSIPAESPVLQAEASAATYSSSRLSSQSLSPVPQTLPDASTLLDAALSPNMAVDTMAFYGALHQLHAESSLTAGDEEGSSQVGTYAEGEVTNGDTAAGLVTPPPTAQSKLKSPQGPKTRSKSARKGLPLPIPASTGPRRRRTVDSPSLSPTEVKIRDGLRRSARLQRESKNSAP
ncbi:hypothetical protein WJX77_008108 [Trebouxia sp. C0004]